MPRYIDAAPYEDGRIVLNKEDAGVPVAEIPTADVVERKKGEWIPYSKVYECRYNCSLCGYDLMGIHESEAKFCPNCGADMRGGGGNVVE